MDMPTLTAFFMWCTIINVALFVWAVVWFVAAPNLMYRVQSAFFPLPRESFDVLMYGFLGGFKILILVFNLVPYVALLIVG